MRKEDIIAFFDRCAPTWDGELVRNEPVIAKILDNGGIRPGIDVLDVACGTGVLQIVELQAPGSKRMNARDYLRGKPMQTGTVLGGSHAE